MNNITAIINTRNAEQYLQEVIDHLKVFDSIIVCDMDSTDSTLQIAKRNGCRILTYKNCGYAEPARNYALKSADTDWVFFVDADEIIPKELSQYLIEKAASPEDVRGISIPRKNMMLDAWNRSTYPDYQLRFLHKDSSEWPAHIHSQPKVNGKIEFIPKERTDLAMIHIAPSVAEIMERLNRYTTAELERRPGEKASLWKMIFKPWSRFFKSYILKGGFRRGINGYFSAKADANYKFYLYAKMYEAALKKQNKK